MANREKLLLLAMISMLLPGAAPDVFADNIIEQEKKTPGRATASCPNTTNSRQESVTEEED